MHTRAVVDRNQRLLVYRHANDSNRIDNRKANYSTAKRGEGYGGFSSLPFLLFLLTDELTDKAFGKTRVWSKETRNGHQGPASRGQEERTHKCPWDDPWKFQVIVLNGTEVPQEKEKTKYLVSEEDYQVSIPFTTSHVHTVQCTV